MWFLFELWLRGGLKKIVRNEFNLCCKGGDPKIYDNSIFPAYVLKKIE